MGKIASQLRVLIKKSGKSANQIAAEAGIAQSSVTRFINGKDMYSETIEKPMAVFDLEVVQRPRQARQRK